MLTLMFGAIGLGDAMNDLGDQKEGVRAMKRIFETVDDSLKSPINGLSLEGEMPQGRSQGRIELRSVYFAYPSRPDVDVCRNYSLVVEPGEVVALVGPSGCGKSTIMSLLLRFYDPRQGQVLLDGIDIRTLNVRWLRAQLGYVGQEPVLFNGSVADNVAKGRAENMKAVPVSLEEAMREDGKGVACFGVCPSAAAAVVDPADEEIGLTNNKSVPDDIMQACISSNAHEFLSKFPDGYNTSVGEGSVLVSGGQKQRIAIARALVRRPAVLLLDEATSALDAASERLVQESIDQLQQSKMQTTLVIAHRLSTIRNADKIAVVDKGEIVELGKHEELLALNGLYAQLWAKQHGKVQSTQSSDALAVLSGVL